jgi:hypothetical protein
MTRRDPMAHRCTAHNRQGDQCRQPAILGGAVCRYHGGAAPQVKLKAEERLKAMVDPALSRLEALSKQEKSLPAAVTATNSILDRAGVGTVQADPSRPPAVTITFLNIPRPGQKVPERFVAPVAAELPPAPVNQPTAAGPPSDHMNQLHARRGDRGGVR